LKKGVSATEETLAFLRTKSGKAYEIQIADAEQEKSEMQGDVTQIEAAVVEVKALAANLKKSVELECYALYTMPLVMFNRDPIEMRKALEVCIDAAGKVKCKDLYLMFSAFAKQLDKHTDCGFWPKDGQAWMNRSGVSNYSTYVHIW